MQTQSEINALFKKAGAILEISEAGVADYVIYSKPSGPGKPATYVVSYQHENGLMEYDGKNWSFCPYDTGTDEDFPLAENTDGREIVSYHISYKPYHYSNPTEEFLKQYNFGHTGTADIVDTTSAI